MGNSIYIHDHLVIYNNSVISPAIGSGSGEKTIYANASGRAFPIWNTIEGNDKLLSLSIHGNTIQEGIPTPENPIPLQLVGDEGLYLYVMQDKESSTFQTLDIKTAMKKAGHDGILRSVNGIYDEVVYDGKEWKLIQRIQNDRIITCIGVSNHQEVGFTDCYFYSTKAPVNGNSPNGLLSTHFVQGNNGLGTMNISSNRPYVGIFRYPNTGEDLTKEEITAWLSENEVYVSYQLAEATEYPLDLPVITTYDEQTYFASNAAEVKPRMVARCQVSKALDYIREGLIGYYTGRGRSNDDENKNVLPDLSGNGNDLENKNFAYTINSGYGDGYIQYDGIDDFSNGKRFEKVKRHIHFVCSDYKNIAKEGTMWSGMTSVSTESVRLWYNGTYIDFTSSSYNESWLNGDKYTNDNRIKPTDKISIWSTNAYTNAFNLDLGSFGHRFFGKVRIYDVLMYDRYLDEEEIQHNYKVSCQYNGEDFSFDPIKQNLVASYRAYDKTNEDEDRDILKDLSGNGHDIQLYNFAFSEGSGYGLYANDFSKFNVHPSNIGRVLYTNSKIEVINNLTNSFLTFSYSKSLELNSTKIRVLNLPKNSVIYYRYVDSSYTQKTIIIRSNGIHDIPSSLLTEAAIDVGFQVGYDSSVDYTGLTIEQIPEYQGALVSDGIDDYGYADNFPVLTRRKGYTVCAIRKWLNIDFIKSPKVFLSTRVYDKNNENPTQWGSFTLEKIIDNNNMHVNNFGANTLIENKNILLMQDVFTYLNSKKYKEKEDINIGNAQHTPRLNLFAGYTFLQSNDRAELSNIALYALEIYNRDLTDEEITKVKARMIAEYESKTGNKYEEE